jgi:hypothetical protein
VRLFDVGRADGFDRLRNPDKSRAHVRRQLGKHMASHGEAGQTLLEQAELAANSWTA